MAGSILVGAFCFLALLVLVAIASPVWLVPIVANGLGLLLLAPFLGRIGDGPAAHHGPRAARRRGRRADGASGPGRRI